MNKGRELGIGDIHGRLKELKNALKAMHYNPEVDTLIPSS